MKIAKEIDNLVVTADAPLREALERMSTNRLRAIFVVNSQGRLTGVMTDGDFRRWLLRQPGVNLEMPVAAATNEKVVSARITDDVAEIRRLLTPRIQIVPLVDDWQRLVAVAQSDTGYMKIGPFEIGDRSPTFLIAEIGNNHNGDMDLAHRLVDEAKAAGADCVKFQMRHMDSLYGGASGKAQDLGVEYTLDLLNRFNLAPEQLFEIFDYAKSLDILPLCTPWDIESVNALEGYGLVSYKVASADLTNTELLEKLAATHKPIILSTGMSRESEIRMAVDLLKRKAAQYILLHCNSAYPAPFEDINLNFLSQLQNLGECPVGYSSHERGISVCLAAVAQGAKVVEKHFTLDRNMEGSDHKVSLLPSEFVELVVGVRQVEKALGFGHRELSQGELLNRESLAKSLVAARDIAEGEMLGPEMLRVQSPGKGLQPIYRDRLIGRRAARAMKVGDYFYNSDIADAVVRPRDYSFRRPWGVPVRYHDYGDFIGKVRPDLLEYHLSYRDLDASIAEHFSERLEVSLVVHAPELFAGDHVLDLTTEDADYRRRSADEMRRVIAAAEELSSYHLPSAPVLIITNVGGFSENGPLAPERRSVAYERLATELDALKSDTVEIIAQTMPPFPWHFGGQRFHNLFVSPDDIASFCGAQGTRICLDVSHSQLACNQMKLSMADFIDTVGPYVAHLHLADAKGLHGEGLQIGEGEISFASIAAHLDRHAPTAGFIPEIWQGHKNEGAGFWTALDKLEQYF